MINNNKNIFGIPEITVDWDGIEEAKEGFEDAVDRQKAENTGSGFTRIREDNASKLNRLTLAGSGIGFASGVAYAFYKKTGFWKGWGYAIIGSITLASLTRGVGFLTSKKTTNEEF